MEQMLSDLTTLGSLSFFKSGPYRAHWGTPTCLIMGYDCSIHNKKNSPVPEFRRAGFLGESRAIGDTLGGFWPSSNRTAKTALPFVAAPS
jgi:hypothetical protein